MNLGNGEGDGGSMTDSMQCHLVDMRVDVLQAIHTCHALGIDGGGSDVRSKLEIF